MMTRKCDLSGPKGAVPGVGDPRAPADHRLANGCYCSWVTATRGSQRPHSAGPGAFTQKKVPSAVMHAPRVATASQPVTGAAQTPPPQAAGPPGCSYLLFRSPSSPSSTPSMSSGHSSPLAALGGSSLSLRNSAASGVGRVWSITVLSFPAFQSLYLSGWNFLTNTSMEIFTMSFRQEHCHKQPEGLQVSSLELLPPPSPSHPHPLWWKVSGTAENHTGFTGWRCAVLAEPSDMEGSRGKGPRTHSAGQVPRRLQDIRRTLSDDEAVHSDPGWSAPAFPATYASPHHSNQSAPDYRSSPAASLK